MSMHNKYKDDAEINRKHRSLYLFNIKRSVVIDELKKF